MGNNKLIIIGNGFDLAHGLKTSYKDFLDWYICKAFKTFCDTGTYSDPLLEIKNKYPGRSLLSGEPTTFQEALDMISGQEYQNLNYKSLFLKNLINQFKTQNWVDIEIYYYRLLKTYFFSNDSVAYKKSIYSLNKDFNSFIKILTEYIIVVNHTLDQVSKLDLPNSNSKFASLFEPFPSGELKFLNFNYTDTLSQKGYAKNSEIIHIHGEASNELNNPIIFGYGDESDPAYQKIEDSGENLYLEHIKSFGYFRTPNYRSLLSYIDVNPFEVYILGHSCGLSDRVLLNEIFEHKNCTKIEIFYHLKKDNSDNFKEITQEISRHFKPINKNTMRRRITAKDNNNFIPQNVS